VPSFSQPVNIGNPKEQTILQFAEQIRDLISPETPIKHLAASQDDPQQRQPDITRAKQVHPMSCYAFILSLLLSSLHLI
jgi:dTDP-glucose 4,6-dehydratase